MANQSALQSEKLRRGSWHEEEDKQLTMFVTRMGEKKWDLMAKASGLERNGKSCRFRWLNYLHPNLKRGCISSEEEGIILQLLRKWGNKWSRIALWLPVRTDNEIKNYWRSHLRKKFPIQPEENFQCKLKVGQQKPPFKKCAIIGPRHGHEDKDVPKSNSQSLIGFSNFEVTKSPYEIRLSNWIAHLTNDDNREVNCHEE